MERVADESDPQLADSLRSWSLPYPPTMICVEAELDPESCGMSIVIGSEVDVDEDEACGWATGADAADAAKGGSSGGSSGGDGST